MSKNTITRLAALQMSGAAFLALDLGTTLTRGLAQSQQTLHAGWAKALSWTTWAAALDSVPGIKADLSTFGSSNEILVALTSGSIDMAPVGYNNVAALLAAGDVPARFVAGLTANGSVFLVRKGSGIRAWQDLRNKKVGTVRGSTQYANLATGMGDHGLDINNPKDVQFISIQNFNDLNLALQRGDVDAICTFPPLSEQALQVGYAEHVPEIQKTLYDGSFFISSGILASDRVIKNNPDVVQAVIGALAKQVHAFSTDHAAWVQRFQSIASSSVDPGLLKQALDSQEILPYTNLNEKQVGLVAKTLSKLNLIPKDTSSQLVQHLDYTFLAKAMGKSPMELGKAS